MRKILELAALRSKRVELGDEVFVCQEPPFAAAAQLSEMLKRDRSEAFAWMLLQFVKKEDGSTPAFDAGEAAQVAGGSSQVIMPLFIAITGFADTEKKASPSTNTSATALPLPSAEPSKN